jgi:hypothetical protein
MGAVYAKVPDIVYVVRVPRNAPIVKVLVYAQIVMVIKIVVFVVGPETPCRFEWKAYQGMYASF